MKPAPSNTSPSSAPSGRSSTALHEPAISTAVLTLSRSATTVTLCGIVISAPRMFVSLNSDRKKAGKSCALQPIGTTTASIPLASNHGL